MTLYKQLLCQIRNKEKFEFDFKNKIIKVGDLDWENLNDEELISKTDLQNYYIDDLFSNPWETADLLFRIYYESVGKSKKYPFFKHKDEKDMTVDELAFGENRQFAEIQLEAYLLILYRLGKLDFGKHYFYQHPIDKEFVVLKLWFLEN